jgi:hypothetical protein
MGTLIRFPDVKFSTSASVRAEPGVVVILPVVRVERHDDPTTGHSAPDAGAPGSRGGRRRARRS